MQASPQNGETQRAQRLENSQGEVAYKTSGAPALKGDFRGASLNGFLALYRSLPSFDRFFEIIRDPRNSRSFFVNLPLVQ
jgi:hypothetical protein